MENIIEQAVRKPAISASGWLVMKFMLRMSLPKGDLLGAVPAGKLRLREIQKVIPLGDWSLNIEEQWKGRTGKTHFRIVDVTTGNLQESIL